MTYEDKISKELELWRKKLLKEPSLFDDFSKSVQNKVQSVIPKKVQKILTESIKVMTNTIVNGSNIITNTKISKNLSLEEMDKLVEEKFTFYHTVGIIEGVSFGNMGIVGGLADFPALLSIKIKFLFDCAKIYGYDMNDKVERTYLLYIFQLAFSGSNHVSKTYKIIKDYDKKPPKEIDWEKFQMEYRDYIDLAKLMQFIPVIGGVTNGIANHNLLLKLKETTMNCYRLRYLSKHKGTGIIDK